MYGICLKSMLHFGYMNTYYHSSALIGRILLGGAFLFSGIQSALSFEMFTMATAYTLPAPTFFALVAIAFKIIGGFSLTVGIYPRIGAAMLALFTVLATLLYHTDFPDDIISFTTHTMVVGGLLGFVAFGGGKYVFGKKRKEFVPTE